MPIVFCSLEIHLPFAQSLKDKRMVLRSAQERLRSRFSFSIAEIQYQDQWQRSVLGAVSIGSDRARLEQVSQEFLRESERIFGEQLIRSDIEFIELELD